MKTQTKTKCMTQVEAARCSNQLGTKCPSVPTVTSWYRHALQRCLEVGGVRGGELRSLGKLAKPLRWFQLKLAVLPVGFINSELTQTLTSMGEHSPLRPHYREAPFVCFPWLFFFFLTVFCILYRAILIRSLRCTKHPKFQTPSQQQKD